MNSPSPSRYHADVLIVTVTEVESDAVQDAFFEATGQHFKPVTCDNRSYCDLGVVAGAHVFMAISELGAGGVGGAQETVRLAIAALNPSAVIMVGIAFGVDKEKQAMGQVLVSQQIHAYELKWLGHAQSVALGDTAHASPRLISWLKVSNQLQPDKAARAKFGLILSGAKVIDNQPFRDELLTAMPDAIGGEMEGEGLYTACHNAKTDWILVKAICDWADGQKEHNRHDNQRLAAHNAARFVLHALQKNPLFSGLQDRPSGKSDNQQGLARPRRDETDRVVNAIPGLMPLDLDKFAKHWPYQRTVLELAFVKQQESHLPIMVANVKDEYCIRVHSKKPGYVLLFAQGTTKTLFQLLPNTVIGAPRLDAGTRFCPGALLPLPTPELGPFDHLYFGNAGFERVIGFWLETLPPMVRLRKLGDQFISTDLQDILAWLHADGRASMAFCMVAVSETAWVSRLGI